MRIAVCEDDAMERGQFLDALRGWDPTRRAEVFSDGESLLKAAGMAPPFSIAFLDIYLPGEDGMDVAAALCEISPETEIVFVTTSPEHAVQAYSLATSLLFPGMLLYSGRFFCFLKESEYNAGGNLLFLLACAAAVAAYLWLIREKPIKKLLVLVIVEFYATTQFWLVNLFFPFLPFGSNGYVYSAVTCLLYFLTMAVLLPVVSLAVMKPMARFLQETEAEEMTREFRTVIIMTNAFVAVMIISDTSVGYSNLAERSVLLCPPVLLLIASEYVIYRLLFLKTIQMREVARQQRAIEIQRIQYEKITREIDHTSRMRHDMRHHLNVLYEMLEQGRSEEASSYIAGLIDSVSQRENQVYCRNFTVNALLQYYVGWARDDGIDCCVRADCGEVTISPADLTVLIGNAMENAIHACLRFPVKEERWIDLRLGMIRGSLVVEIRNSCQGVRLSVSHQGEKGFLPAEAFLSERTGGGLGLRSISHTAEKYRGEALFRFDGGKNTFTSRIRLNLNPEMLEEG